MLTSKDEGKPRILVVDDDARIVNFLSSKLRWSGYGDVLAAANGKEAIAQVKAQDPDMIILDILMPEMDGFAALQEIRTFSQVPVIILSALDKTADKIKGLSKGADDFVMKPFNPDELLARIEAVWRRSSSWKKHA